MATSLESVADKKASKADNISNRARDILDRFKGGGGKEHQQLVEEELVENIMLSNYDANSNAYSNSYSDEELSPVEKRTPRMRVTVVSDATDSSRTPNELWREREAEKAERLANWATFEETKRRTSVWSRLIPNGTEKTPSTYGSTTRSPSEHQNGTAVKHDRWTTAIKQIQKHKKIVGRNRAKLIDQKSRWIFPLTFFVFNVSYWSYYLYFKEDEKRGN